MSVVSDIVGGIFGGGGDGDGGAAAANAISREGIDEIRKQLGIVQEDVRPFIELGQAQIPGVERAATVGGLDEIFGEIFGTDTFKNLVGERRRGVEGALSAGGLTRSGTAIEELSAVPQDIALAIEQLISGRQSNLLRGGQSSALDLGGLGLQGAANIGGIATGAANRVFQGEQAGLQRESDLLGGLIGAGGSVLGGLAAGGFFSDSKLKENIEKIGNIGILNLYQWDWAPETKGTVIGEFPTMGFISTEVKKIYPEFVKKVLGFDFIDYQGVLNRIEQENELLAA